MGCAVLIGAVHLELRSRFAEHRLTTIESGVAGNQSSADGSEGSALSGKRYRVAGLFGLRSVAGEDAIEQDDIRRLKKIFLSVTISAW
jgi:hypothetical protein